MKEKRLLKHGYNWMPPSKRKSRFPGNDKPHRIGKPETRKPYLWVKRSASIQLESDLFLINDSGEVLEEVISNIYGFVTSDEDVHPFSSKASYSYKNVQPGEAVKVEEYNEMLDSDFVLGLSVQVKSNRLGEIEISIMSTKGGIGEIVLLWDTLETGPNTK